MKYPWAEIINKEMADDLFAQNFIDEIMTSQSTISGITTAPITATITAPTTAPTTTPITATTSDPTTVPATSLETGEDEPILISETRAGRLTTSGRLPLASTSRTDEPISSVTNCNIIEVATQTDFSPPQKRKYTKRKMKSGFHSNSLIHNINKFISKNLIPNNSELKVAETPAKK